MTSLVKLPGGAVLEPLAGVELISLWSRLFSRDETPYCATIEIRSRNAPGKICFKQSDPSPPLVGPRAVGAWASDCGTYAGQSARGTIGVPVGGAKNGIRSSITRGPHVRLWRLAPETCQREKNNLEITGKDDAPIGGITVTFVRPPPSQDDHVSPPARITR
jgi:hypothetical protein